MSRAKLCLATLLLLVLGSCSGSLDKVCTGDGCVDLPTMCPCPQESFCDLSVNSCKAGCIHDTDCRSGRVCDPATSLCRDLSGGPCPCNKGAYCDLASNSCMAGCTSADNCLAGQTCDVGQRKCMDPPGTLRIEPTVVHLSVMAGAQKATVQAISNSAGDVTTKAVWSLSDTSIGTIDKGTLTVRGGGKGGAYTIQAAYNNATATAALILAANVAVVDPSAPPDAPGDFGGAAGGPALAVAYPISNTMLPPNLLQLKLQWTRDLAQKVFRIRVSSGTFQGDMYVGDTLCSAEKCIYPVPDTTWRQIAQALVGQSAKLQVSGVAGKDGAVGSSPAIDLTFSPEDVAGGVYYFATSSKGIRRAVFGAKKATDFVINGDETGCAGCHAVSRDGKQVAIEYGSGQTAVGSTVVSGNRASHRNFPLNRAIAWNFAWFNPAGDSIIANWSGGLSVRAASDGHILSTVAPSQYGTGYAGGVMPEWSPDGKWIAFVRVHALPMYDFELTSEGDIAIMPYNDGAFGAAVPLVLGNLNADVHFWPTWSPDSKWLVFNSQTCGGGCQQYDATNTRLRMVRAVMDDGTAAVSPTPIELLEGTHLKNNQNNWPKFAPFYQAGRYGYIIYSARYAYGFDAGGTSQMFMFGVDMEKAKAGHDPSYRPIHLPFQDSTATNHSAIWTTDIRCDDATDCSDEYQCMMNVCTPML